MLDQEKPLPSGETITINRTATGARLTRVVWEVNCWDSMDNNRWSRVFDNYDDAKKEYDRWN